MSLHINGSDKIASVKIEKNGSDLSGLFIKKADELIPSSTTADFITLNCTNKGEFVTAGTDFKFLVVPGDYTGADLVICTSDRRVMRTKIDLTVKANGFESRTVDFKADENVLWYDGFDLCAWGGNIMGGSESAGMSPTSEPMTSATGADRRGTEFALSSVAYNVPGTGFIQSDWGSISGKTVGDAHNMSGDYVVSRNFSDYAYLFRAQEFQGAMAVSFATTARGIIADRKSVV